MSRRDTERNGAVWFRQDFSWTDLGQIEDLTYPNCLIPTECTAVGNPSGQPSRTVTHGYKQGFLTSLSGFASSLTYHPNEMLASVVHTNGVTDVFDPDPQSMRRPGRIRTTNVSGTDFDTGVYQFDGAGNVKAMGVDSFAYDGVSRLVSGTSMQAQVSEAAAYDAFGNRVAADTFPVGSRPIDVSASTNRLLGTPKRPVTYDSRGNQTRWGSAFYTYDAFDQLAVHEDAPAGTDSSYVYTADDERIVSITNPPNASETWTLRDLDGLVLRRFYRETGDTDWPKDVIHRQGQVLATVGLTGTEHAHLDHLGTVRLWTGPGGGNSSSHVYTAFGEEVLDNFDAQEHRYTGHERDVSRSAGQ